jgi:hypothetical protein
MSKPGELKAMISSTSVDLPDHRPQVRDACLCEGFYPDMMESLPARDVDAIRVSLEMVDRADIYIGIFAHRYGHIPAEHDISITEMEFRRAEERGIPIFVFLIDEAHPITIRMVEQSDSARTKLSALKDRVCKNRGRALFKSPEDLRAKVIQALSAYKDREVRPNEPVLLTDSNPIPKPPAFYAEPDYIGSHKFVGRARELEELTDWAKPADPTNLLLFEAIGGNGKSMLTWEWTRNYALAARPADSPWAGRFWYSFYERGAIMADFCQRALAYMTGRPLEHYAKKKTAELKDELLAQLHARPWLLILDGLERVLVAYHRVDAAEVPDEEANAPTDKIANRNPCDAIRDEDNDLLRALAAAVPSKLLVSSRLTPRVLLNSSGQPVTGAKRITLPGLRPPDAEALLRSCGIKGNSAAIQSYLTANCDNHPLVIGILGGLIVNYLPARGNFDTWSIDDDGGAALDLASLDLIQRRNHILRAALDALPLGSKQLLSTLALLSESVNYQTLAALNPHILPKPEEVKIPQPPEGRGRWQRMSNDERAEAKEKYQTALLRRMEFEIQEKAWIDSTEVRVREAARKLAETVIDLEQRGLLQYDGQARRHYVHPVVRSIAAGGLQQEDKNQYGQRLVDHFSRQAHNPYAQARALDDLRGGLTVVRACLQMRRYRHGINALGSGLLKALIHNLEEYAVALSLLSPFYSRGWDSPPEGLSRAQARQLSHHAALALRNSGEIDQAILVDGATLRACAEDSDWVLVRSCISGIATSLFFQKHIAKTERFCQYALEFAALHGNTESLFIARSNCFRILYTTGRWNEAERMLKLRGPLRTLPQRDYNWLARQRSFTAKAEADLVRFYFFRGDSIDNSLLLAEKVAKRDNVRTSRRELLRIRGAWRVDQHDWSNAAVSFQEAVNMARERGRLDVFSETGFALAKHHLGQLPSPRDEAERLVQLRNPAHRYLALLWLAIGDFENAKHHALAAYKWAWADGEPYVNRYELTKTIELLQQMNVPIPNLPPYDPTKDEPLPWEADVRVAIEKLCAEKEAKKQPKKG